MNKLFLCVFSVIISVVILSCAGNQGTVQQTSSEKASNENTSQTIKSAWEQEWDKAVTDAKKEGRVVLYTGIASELRQDITKAFRESHPYIEVEYFAARPLEVAQKLLAEQKAGLNLADIYVMGATSMMTVLKPAGSIVPLSPYLVLPEVTDPKVWFENAVPFIDKDKIIVAFMARPNPQITVNTTMVKTGEIKSYKDLLEPRWKGKIIMEDPTQTGSALKFVGVVGSRILDFDYIRQFARQEPLITKDSRLTVEWVARGKYPVGIALNSAILVEYQKAGSPVVQISAIEGDYLTSGWGCVAVVRSAPHQNAAKVFLNWLLSKNGQLAWSKSELRQSARVDVPTGHLDPMHLRQPGIKYISGDDEELLLEQPKHAEMAKEIFGPLMK